MAKKKTTQQTKKPQNAPLGIQDVDLAKDAAKLVGTAIGVVGGTAAFIGSKVAEVVAGTPTKPASQAKTKSASKATKKTAAKKAAGSKKQSSKPAVKQAASKKAASKKSGSKKAGSKKAGGKKASKKASKKPAATK
jgi:hypothetical protein